LHIIDNFILEVLNIAPTWSYSSRVGSVISACYTLGFFILTLIAYFTIRFLSKKRSSLDSSVILSLSLTITSSFAFLVSTVFFILFWVWNWDHIDYHMPVLPIYLFPFALFFLLTLSFLIWFLVKRRKLSADNAPVKLSSE